MPATNPDIRRVGGKIGARRRWQPGSSEEELLADLEQARNDDLIDKVAEAAPKMTPQQTDRLRLLLGAGT